MTRLALAFAAALLLIACTPVDDPMLDAGTCPAADLQALVGQPESAVAGITYQGPIRVVHPGQPVTMDYIPQRLGIEIDAGGLIARLSCG